MKSSDREAIIDISEKTGKILGTATMQDNGWNIDISIANKVFALPDELIRGWTTRPAIVTPSSPAGPFEAEPLEKGSGKLVVFRAPHTINYEQFPSRVVELDLRHQEEMRDIYWVYSLVVWKGPRSIKAETTHYKKSRDFYSDKFRLPESGEVQEQTPSTDQLIAFNRYLTYASGVDPVRTSVSRHRIW